jgi:hypothetical protein
MITVVEFHRKFRAYATRASDEYRPSLHTMQETWANASPMYLAWVVNLPGVLKLRDWRLFACFCVRQAEHMLEYQEFLDSVKTAELYSNGKAAENELCEAHRRAKCVLDDHHTGPWKAMEAAWDAMEAAWKVSSADKDIPCMVNHDCANALADCAAAKAYEMSQDVLSHKDMWTAYGWARNVAIAGAYKEQAKYLRKHCVPNFEGD